MENMLVTMESSAGPIHPEVLKSAPGSTRTAAATIPLGWTLVI